MSAQFADGIFTVNGQAIRHMELESPPELRGWAAMVHGGAICQAKLGTRTSTATSFRPIWVAFSMLMAASAAINMASAQDHMKAEAPIAFKIAAQPLSSALDAYTASTDLEIIYDSDLAAGRRSTDVEGVLMPDVALRILLEGTGLSAFSTDNAFTIVPASRSNEQSARSIRPEHMPYLALVQASIEHAFCQQAETIPGRYRAALRFRIGTSGVVLYPQILSSTGNIERDQKIIELLRRLNIGRPPPLEIPQPLTFVVSPRPPALSGDCQIGQAQLARQAGR